jgi:hypothetical protein
MKIKRGTHTKQTPSAERLRTLLHYCEETGQFTWRVNRGGKAIAGTIAGTPDKHGYICINVDCRLYKAHRLAWLYVHGEWPEREIDHIDGHPANNSISNLRVADRHDQNRNRRINKTNRLGVKGVRQFGLRFEARIKVNYQNIVIGRYDTAQEAHAAYVREATRRFGEFARAG